jgi:hypothetical protein
MALVLKDRVLETASAPGTGVVTLLGAVGGYQSFSAGVGNANTCYYTIADQSGANWEVGIGTYATAGNTLTRTTLISSSTGSTVNFSSGTQNVFVTYPAEKAVYLDAAGQTTLTGQLNLTNASNYNLYASGAGANYMAGALYLGQNYYTTVGIGLNYNSGAVTGGGILQDTTISAATTTSYEGNATYIATAASAFTLANLRHFVAKQATVGASSAVTNQFGFQADGSLVGATNNYGFYSGIASGTGRYNFYAAGTADNYFAGSVGVGAVAPASVQLNISSGSGSTQQRIVETVSGVDTRLQAVGGAGLAGITGTWTNFPFVFYTNTTERGRIGNTGTWSLGAAPGAESLRVTPVASAVNYFEAQGSATGGTPVLYVSGSDTNISSVITSKGAGNVQIRTNSGNQIQFVVTHVPSAVNYLQAGGNSVGTNPYILAQGADTNVGVLLSSKGTGDIQFRTNSGAQLQFNVAHTASAVNYLYVSGGVTGNPAYFSSTGSDTNIGINYVSKGNGTQQFFVGANAVLRLDGGASSPNALQIYSGSGSYALTFIGTDTNISTTYTTKGTGYHAFATGGGTQFAVLNTASAVNYMQVFGGATTFGPTIQATGTDTNVNMTLSTKGTGNFTFYSANSYPQLVVANTTSAVNYMQTTGAITGDAPYLYGNGSDTNVGIKFSGKGTGATVFYSNTFASAQFVVAHTASAVNYLQATGGATGSFPQLAAQGTDTNIGMSYFTKGAGYHFFYNGAGSPQFAINPTASAVNYLQTTGGATNNAPTITSTGSDTDIGMALRTKGAAGFEFYSATGGSLQFYIYPTSTAVNYVQVSGSATSGPVGVSAKGSDTNIDISLSPKGTGVVQYGTYTAGIVTQTGYITIKDAGGTSRRLLVG